MEVRPLSGRKCWQRNKGGTARPAMASDKICTRTPDFTRHKNAAPFKRNDQLLAVLPIGVVVFPGSGISDNLADKAKALGIPLFDFRTDEGRNDRRT
jgi:hypothetical protein